jgi:S-formylglutathione hydrolase FrmB
VRRLLLLGALTLALPGAPAAHAQRIAGERQLENGGIELTIATPAFTAPTRAQVFLPDGYAAHPKRRWPVTYYLHGAQDNEARFYPWYGKLIKDYPSIVVAPDGGQIGFYSDWYNGGAGGPPMYETYDIDQLIPLIDGRFRTIAHRRGRVVIGESMGGYGVMTLAARHPDVFAAAASLSGAVDSNHYGAIALISAGPPIQGGEPNAIYGPRATEEIRWHGHNPTDLAANLRDVDLQVRTAQGSPNPPAEGGDPSSAAGCTLEHGIHDMSVSFHQQLTAQRVPHVWKDYGPGCHSIPMFQREFADALPGLERVLADPPRPPRTFGYRSIEPRFHVWGWRIAADPARALEFLELRDAGRGGVTLVGSGTTRVRTPRFFRGVKAVRVGDRVLRPGRRGRLRFTVDLGPAHTVQQGTPGASEEFTTRTVRFDAR